MQRCHNARVLLSGFSRAASCAIAFNNISPGAIAVLVAARADTYDTLTDFHGGTRRINFSRWIYTKNLHESARVAKLVELSRVALDQAENFSLFLFLSALLWYICLCEYYNIIIQKYSCELTSIVGWFANGDICSRHEKRLISLHNLDEHGVISLQLPLASVSIAENVFFTTQKPLFTQRVKAEVCTSNFTC